MDAAAAIKGLAVGTMEYFILFETVCRRSVLSHCACSPKGTGTSFFEFEETSSVGAVVRYRVMSIKDRNQASSLGMMMAVCRWHLGHIGFDSQWR